MATPMHSLGRFLLSSAVVLVSRRESFGRIDEGVVGSLIYARDPFLPHKSLDNAARGDCSIEHQATTLSAFSLVPSSSSILNVLAQHSLPVSHLGRCERAYSHKFKMGIGEVLEPLVVLILLFGGTWVNRASNFSLARVHARRRSTDFARAASPDSLESRYASPTSKDELLSPRCRSPSTPILANKWRKRNLKFLGISEVITTPDTAVFHDRLCSRLTRRLPFLMECWYWALIYWVS